MSASFGYNRAHEEQDYEAPDALLYSFIDTVSKNGNLLLNIGLRGEDASIPEPQTRRLEFIGEWLSSNGEAIYETRPWKRAEGETGADTEVRYLASNTKARNVFAAEGLSFEIDQPWAASVAHAFRVSPTPID